MNKLSNYKKELVIFFLSFLSLIYSFFLNEDGTGGGAKGDFEATYGFILALQENLLANPKEWTLVHTPLHFLILSLITKLIHDPYILRLLFLIFSISIPLTFYLIISKLIQKNKVEGNLLIITSCIFFIPSFRYTSIWCNNLITSIFFFLISIYFFYKWQIVKEKELNKNLLLQIFFLVLATYTRQYFAVFFIYFLKKYYDIISFRNFIKLFGICVLSSIPVFFYVYKFPALLTEQFISFHALNYFFLGNPAIMFTTVFPIVMINFLYKKILYRKILIPCLISFSLVYLFSLNFNGIGWQGGGINYFLSQKIFHNNIYFYFTSFFTISVFIYLSIENKSNSIILITLILMFFSYQVYQRYYDPMFFIIFFLLIKTDLTKIFFKKKIACYLLLFYFILFYLGTVSKILYKL
jgi:hypothetical protein